MIAYLRGTLLEKHPNQVIVDVHGVGYEVTIPVSAYSSLPEKGAEVRLHIHTHVREDALLLFGFVTAADKAVFEKLITVSGIGPTLAVKALGGLAAPELAAAIRSGAIEQLVRIPGVGKKTAERMVLELRDKLDLAGLPARPDAAAPKSILRRQRGRRDLRADEFRRGALRRRSRGDQGQLGDRAECLRRAVPAGLKLVR